MMKRKRTWSKLMIAFGTLLILGGLFGFSQLNNSKLNIYNKGNFHYFPKITKIIQPIKFDMETKEILEAPGPVGSQISLLNPGHMYIHTKEKPWLEEPAIPDKIEIPAIDLIAPVVISDFNVTKIEAETFGQWIAPSKFAAGWQPNSALLGEKGNTVINGHHNEFGEVFGKLIDVEVGEIIIVSSGDKTVKFVVSNKMILAERFQTAEVRLDNARWLANTNDIRLTLVTCYPKESNTHRLIIVARLLTN